MLLDGAASNATAICYRDVAAASNRVTLIAAAPAARSGRHPYRLLREDTPWRRGHLVPDGLFNSLVANYLVRLQMSTHVTTALMARLVPEARGRQPGSRGASNRWRSH